jgi:hypothetical protein
MYGTGGLVLASYLLAACTFWHAGGDASVSALLRRSALGASQGQRLRPFLVHPRKVAVANRSCHAPSISLLFPVRYLLPSAATVSQPLILRVLIQSPDLVGEDLAVGNCPHNIVPGGSLV